MMRLLFITDYLVAGGIEHQLTQLVTRLDRSRFEPHVLCLYGDRAGAGRFEAPLHFLPVLADAGVPVRVLDVGMGAVDKLRAARGIVGEVRRLRPQVVHTYNYHSNMLTRLVKPFYPPDVRLLGSLRSWYTQKQLQFTRVTQWACDAIVTLAPFQAEQLMRDGGVAAEKIHIIPNGVDAERFRHNPQPELRARLVPSARRVLLMMGRVSAEKAPYLLAEALAILARRGDLPTDVRALIVGEREHAATQARLAAAVGSAALENVVVQHPKTNQPEAFFHLADVTVLTSLLEGLPNVVLESLMAGRPVVISEAANRAGVIEQGVNGWVVRTDDAQHLAQTLAQVLALSDEALAAMRSACRVTAERYSLSGMVASYEALYAQLA